MKRGNKILVVGATGYVGGHLVSRLVQAGYDVRCLARNPARLTGRSWGSVEVVRGDVLRPETLPVALEGVSVAYYLVHSMGAGEQSFEEQDLEAARNFGRAAKEAGVARVVYLGGLGHGDSRSSHLRSRQETGDMLRAEGPPVTEFRAAVIVGPGSISFELIRYLTERLPVLICPRWVSTRCQPIGIGDVLRYLVECLEEPRSVGRILEIGGADVLTYGDMMKQYAKMRGLSRWLINVPVLTPRLSSYWVDFVTPIPARIVRPLIEGLRSEVVVHDPVARDMFPWQPHSYKDAVYSALEREESNAVEIVWSTPLSALSRAAEPDQLTTTQGMILDKRQIEVATSAEQVYRTFMGIGGKRGWFAFDWAWRLRGMMDRAIGGVGLRRGRRSADDLLPGEALDFWRVEMVETNHLLRLRAEMKVPGRAWLQFEVVPLTSQSCTLTQTAFFEPHGLGGHLYWYFLYPIHVLIFKRMLNAVGRRALSALSPPRRARETAPLYS